MPSDKALNRTSPKNIIIMSFVVVSLCSVISHALGAEAVLPIRARIINCQQDVLACESIGVTVQVVEPLFVDEACNGENPPPECIEPAAGDEIAPPIVIEP